MYDYDLIFWGAVFAVMVIAELASFSIDLDLVCHRRSCYIHNGVVRSRIRNSDACFYCSINSSSIVYQAFIKKNLQ